MMNNYNKTKDMKDKRFMHIVRDGKLQGRSEKQYRNSARFFLWAFIGLVVVALLSAIFYH